MPNVRSLHAWWIAMPADWPEAEYTPPFELVETKRFASDLSRFIEFEAAWQGIAFRFIAMAEHSEAFKTLSTQRGFMLSGRERYEQEHHLFGFFLNGLSVIDTLCYGIYFLGAMADPTAFPNADAQNSKKITIDRTASSYRTGFPTERITDDLATLITDVTFLDLKELRNIFAHRTAPARYHDLTTDPDTTILPGAANRLLEANTTDRYRQMISVTLRNIMSSVFTFADVQLH